MASWKKVIVSGSNISQLNNDSNYLIVTDTIDSASVAARATTLSPDATASFADRATTASFADLAGSIRSGLTASHADRATSASLADVATLARAGSGSFSGSFEGNFVGTTDLPDLTDGNGIVDFTYDGSSTATIAVEADGATLTVGASGVKVSDGGITQAQLATGSVSTDQIIDGKVTNAKLANSSVTVGTTEIALGASSTTLAGLTDVVGTKFSGSFSGSFQGDGSNLTGLATNLDFAGDTGTDTLNLITDTLTFSGTANEITTAVTDNTVTISLPDDVTIGQDLTVTRDLTVSRNLTVVGTASFQATTDLDVADRFIRLASGSNAAGEGGFVVQQGSNGLGEVFGYDQTTLRFGVSSSFDATQNVFTPDAYFANVVEGAGDDPTAAIAKYTKKGNTFVANNGDIYIYS